MYHAFFSSFAFGREIFSKLVLPLGACLFATILFLVPNPMHSLLCLLGVFFTTVLLYLTQGIAFVGLVFLIVYVGAVAVLFLFVLMLLNVKSLTKNQPLIQFVTQIVAILMVLLLIYLLCTEILLLAEFASLWGNLIEIGLEPTTGEAVIFFVQFVASDIVALMPLYTIHSVLFLVTTALLLVSLLGAIILATVTTERATSVLDIYSYIAPGQAVRSVQSVQAPVWMLYALVFTPVVNAGLQTFDLIAVAAATLPLGGKLNKQIFEDESDPTEAEFVPKIT